MRHGIFGKTKLFSFFRATKIPSRRISDLRIHFSGQFMTNPSTINNSIGNYSQAIKLCRDQFKKAITDFRDNSKGAWNPYGSHAWTFENCNVTYACNGTEQDSSLDGCPVNPVRSETIGRIADLDPQMQNLSQIWGFKVSIGNLLSGDFHPAAFAEIWKRRDGIKGASLYSAVYHSVLKNVQIHSSADSLVLKELKKSSQQNGNKLSIRMVVDGYQTKNDELFNRGRVVGSIFPYIQNHPYTALVGRHIIIDPAEYPVPDNRDKLGARTLKAKLTHQCLLVDFSNFIPTNTDLSLKNIGDIYIGYYDGECRKEIAVLSVSQYTNTQEFYMKDVGIVSFPLNSSDIHNIKNTPLVCWYQNDTNKEVEYRENPHGIYFAADQLFHRLEAGEVFSETEDTHHQARFYASKFGELMPLSNNDIFLTTSICNFSANDKKKMSDETIKAIENSKELALKAEVLPSHGKKNWALMKMFAPKSLKLDFGPLGKQPPRYEFGMDSLVYEINYFLKLSGQTTVLGYHPIYCLVFDDFAISEIPTWIKHIKPIFTQYANLYPVMFNILDLSDYPSVIENLSSLKRAFSAKKTDQFYMPVTRDLSSNKQKMIIQWLNNPIYSSNPPLTLKEIKQIKDLKIALQQAIQLELTTILLYMTALYSIKPDCNKDVATLLQNILRQEMRHMLMACNLLNAIGGRPEIEAASPRFPSLLPGDVLPKLIVDLGPCTREKIEKFFMTIEEPGYISHDDLMEIIKRSSSEHKITSSQIDSFTYTRSLTGDKRVTVTFHLSDNQSMSYVAKKHHIIPAEVSNTIGQFYNNISKGFDFLNQLNSKQLFCGDPHKQMNSDDLPGIFAVYNLETARSAIEKIATEGEGTSFVQPTNEHGELAHYFKFLQIILGKKIVRVKQEHTIDKETYQFILGDKINLDEEHGVITDKSVWENQSQEPRLLLFIETYATLLTSLQRVFDGHHEEFRQTIATMRLLQVQAIQLLWPPHIQDTEYQSIAPNFDLSKIKPKSSSQSYDSIKQIGVFSKKNSKKITDDTQIGHDVSPKPS